MPSHAVVWGIEAPSRGAPWPPSPKLAELGLSRETSPALPVRDHSRSRPPPLTAERARWPHMSSPTPFPPSGPTRSQPSLTLSGLTRGAPQPRTPPFRPARRPHEATSQTPGICDRPRPRESRPPQRPEPASGAPGPRPASLCDRPRGAGRRALPESPWLTTTLGLTVDMTEPVG